MIKKSTQICIIGGGLAGTTLAWELHLKSIGFQLIDLSKPKATLKAAGIFNPVVFKRLTKSYMIDECLPVAKEFYQKIEKITNEVFFFEKPLFKTINNIGGQNQWEARIGDSNFADYLKPISSEKFEHLKNYQAWGEVKQAGFVDTKTYLNASQLFFEKEGRFQQIEKLSNYLMGTDGWIVKNNGLEINTQKIVFCEGAYATENPLWNFLPFRATKGETLTIKTEAQIPDAIFKKDFFLLPIGNKQYKVGATYQWDNLDWEPSDEGKLTLIEKLEEILDCPYQIIEHTAGIRPNTNDRKPFLGEHPINKQMFVFNGLGSKGVVLAPYFAKKVCNQVLNNVDPNKEFSILRFLNNE